MTWVSLILAVLEGVSRLMGYLQDRQKINEGEAIQIAKASAEIMRKSKYAKDSLAEFEGRSASDVDDFLRGLGGDSGAGGDSK